MAFSVLLPVLLALVANAEPGSAYNLRPTIGILSQEPTDDILDLLEDKNYTSYIAASYVKYVEGSGARAVPILINQDDSYYEKMASSVNGIILPGGSVSITNSSAYGLAAQKVYEHVVKANKEGIILPLWGTCLGFEIITYLGANYENWLEGCLARNKADKLTLQIGFMDSRIFDQMPHYVIDYVSLWKTTVNFHDWCITPENFTKSGLIEDFKILATSFDYNDLEYVALIEHNEMPIFGSQFHPEKNPYEWANDKEHSAIPHDPFSVGVAHYFSNFFVNQARYNNQHFATKKEENEALIYNHDTTFTGELGSGFTECYFFR
ncbi:gamma-glutamyl hydrolase-like [Palaemon carinicauda]|uniref:gamma-glutamyl hydrolase-like n=1 Tax=Palaemon carinicauda TaxID=392227 RepID=UPI0035B5CCF6